MSTRSRNSSDHCCASHYAAFDFAQSRSAQLSVSSLVRTALASPSSSNRELRRLQTGTESQLRNSSSSPSASNSQCLSTPSSRTLCDTRYLTRDFRNAFSLRSGSDSANSRSDSGNKTVNLYSLEEFGAQQRKAACPREFCPLVFQIVET